MFNAGVAITLFEVTPGFWARFSILYVMLISLYANFATDYGAVSAAQASTAAGPVGKNFKQQQDELAADRELLRTNVELTREVHRLLKELKK